MRAAYADGRDVAVLPPLEVASIIASSSSAGFDTPELF